MSQTPPTPTHTQHPTQTVSNERGSILPYVSVAAALVAFVALGLMTGLGDAILHRRDASNAADAAALAAASTWAGSIESTYENAVDATSEDGLWSNAGKGLGSFAGPGARRAAERYASLDGATLTAYSVDTSQGTITVSVRTKSAVTGTDQRLTATSTAKIVFEDGACLSDGQVGFEINGTCVTKRPQTKAPVRKKDAKPAPSASATPTPFKVPDGMSRKAKVSARLVN